MKKNLIVLSSVILGSAPFMALAATSAACTAALALPNGGTIQKVLCTIGNILDTVITVLVILGVVYFIWGVVQYVISSDEEAKKAGKDRMIYGIIGLVVIVALWGLVGILSSTFGLGAGYTPPALPTVTY